MHWANFIQTPLVKFRGGKWIIEKWMANQPESVFEPDVDATEGFSMTIWEFSTSLVAWLNDVHLLGFVFFGWLHCFEAGFHDGNRGWNITVDDVWVVVMELAVVILIGITGWTEARYIKRNRDMNEFGKIIFENFV